jgi:hypothetical protein
MKKTRNTALFAFVCVFATFGLSAQVKKPAAKKQDEEKTDIIVIKTDTVPPTDVDLLESIQRDVKKNEGKTPEAKPQTSENSPVKEPQEPEKVVVSKPRPARISKPRVNYHHELQLEAGAFLNQLFRVFGLVKEGQPYNASPYFVAYKYRLSTKNDKSGALRIGLGGIFDRREETVGGFADKKQTDTTALNGRLGFEFQRDLGNDFKWIFGADFILQNNQKRLYSDSGVDQVVDKTVGWTKGVGLVMGIRWDFTDRASIGSEMNLQFLNFQGERTQKFTANPQFNKLIGNVNNSNTSFLGPANIYLSWRF